MITAFLTGFGLILGLASGIYVVFKLTDLMLTKHYKIKIHAKEKKD